MKIADASGINMPLNNTTSTKNDEDKAKEIFKTVFLEKMVSEMFKTTKLFSGENQTQNDFYEQQMVESISDQFMQSSDIRWNQLFNGAIQTPKIENEK